MAGFREIEEAAATINGAPQDPFILMEGSDWTVAAPKRKGKSSGAYQTEAQLENAFMKQLEEQGYEIAAIHDDKALIANLRTQLERLNQLSFSDKEWDRLFSQVLCNKNMGILEKTKLIQEERRISFVRDDGKTVNIKLIDDKNIHENKLQVTHQFVQNDGTHPTRYDVTILVNGFPLVQVELKRRGVNLREAFNQIERYKDNSFWAGSGLYQYIQIFVISNGTLTKYYSTTTRQNLLDDKVRGKMSSKGSSSYKFTQWWAGPDNKRIESLESFTETFFAKHALLAILTKYCVLTAPQKGKSALMVMRPYQIIAAERILNRILIAENNPSRLGTTKAGGYIWHTTGSGKTLTSFKTAQLASAIEGVDKIVFVVDRKDLDKQTKEEFNKFQKDSVNASASTKELKENLEDPDRKMVVTTIQKLDRFITKFPQHATYKQHIVFIFDECHRSQFGDMNKRIKKHFSNYHMFGFTGTPIFALNNEQVSLGANTTPEVFGDKLHTYTIVDGIQDENVLPFRIDYIATVSRKRDIQDEEAIAIDPREALFHRKRIKNNVTYILEHYAQKTKRDSIVAGSAGEKRRGFNSLLAADSIDMAKLYYEEFKHQQAQSTKDPLKVGIIYTYASNASREDTTLPEENFDASTLNQPDREFLDKAIQDYNEMFHTNYGTDGNLFDGYYNDVSERLKNREIDILIVVNMFLTGFDAPTLNTLWVDKNLKHHGLIQAFSRTNRILDNVKTFGNIVCFRDIEEEVDEAISLFGDRNAGGIVKLKPYVDYFVEYEKVLETIQALSPKGEPLVGEQAEREFIKAFGRLLRLRNILVAFDEFGEDDPLPEIDYQNYLSRYEDLREKWAEKIKPEVAHIMNDLVFETELLKSVDVNIDYILMLVEKFHESNCEDREIRAKIERLISGSYQLRSKKDLIDAFIEEVSGRKDVHVAEEWSIYVQEQMDKRIQFLIDEYKLNPALTRDVLLEGLKDGAIAEAGTGISDLLLAPKSLFGGDAEETLEKQTHSVYEAFQHFVEYFSGLIRVD